MPDHQERGGYSPAPPLDTDEFKGGVPWTGGLSRGDIVGIIAFVLFVALYVGVAFVSESSYQSRTAFMASCIEFHSVDRCHELWRYGRTDLARKDMKP